MGRTYRFDDTHIERSRAMKRSWRKRREYPKGICDYCFEPVYSGGKKKGDKYYHKTCYEFLKQGLTRRQTGFAYANPNIDYLRLLKNPRPPVQWWAEMWPRIVKEYPRQARESLEHYRKSVSNIIAGIWYKYPQATREKLIKKYG